MLIPAGQVNYAMSLSITEVCDALRLGGYTVERGEITGVDFKGMNESGAFVYEISGPSPEENEDDVSLGNVYLKFKRKPFTKTFELFEIHGDY